MAHETYQLDATQTQPRHLHQAKQYLVTISVATDQQLGRGALPCYTEQESVVEGPRRIMMLPRQVNGLAHA